MVQRFLLFIVFFAFLFLHFSLNAQAAVENPEIPDGLVWMNSSRSIKIQELKGKFVVVYFWNYSAQNIQSVIEQCRELQEKYPSQVVIIGVHTGKALNNDRLNDRVANALTTYRIAQPVVVDDQMRILKDFRFDQIPSAILFAPDGSVLFRKTGSENLFYLFNQLIGRNIPRFDKQMDLIIYDFMQWQESLLSTHDQLFSQVAIKDLPDKVLQPGLLGNTILDSHQTMTSEVTKDLDSSDSQWAKENSPLIESHDDFTPQTDDQSTKTLDLTDYIGQKIIIDREYSHKIGQIQFRLNLGMNAKLLGEQKSFVRIYADDHTVLTQRYLNDLYLDVPVNHEFSAKKLYVEVVLYYCTHEQKALCRIKSLLFVVPLNDYSKVEDIQISFNLPESET